METSKTPSDLTHAAKARERLGYSRWWQLGAAALMMALVSPYQYLWSSLESPLATTFEASVASIGFVFSVYVITMALTQFPAGWYRDRFGPRSISILGGVLAGSGYGGIAFSTELWQLFVCYAIGSVGVGIVYTVTVNTAIKWFPDKRGLTTGVGTMAFGLGGAAFIPFVRMYGSPERIQTVLLVLGAVIACGVVIGAVILRDPPDQWHVDSRAEPTEAEMVEAAARQYTWREMIRTWQFWVLYFMFVGVSAAGLMITARIVVYSQHLGLTAIVATIAATLLPIASGGGRLLVGWASDYLPRERVMAIAFLTCGISTFLIVFFGGLGVISVYVLAVLVAVFFWSSQFSLFPSVVSEYYGIKHSSSNYALVYSAKMWGGVFGGGVVGGLVLYVGWDAAFLVGGSLALLAGVGALVIRPPASADS